MGQRLSRTAAACGFRWNSMVRKKYDKQIQQAKKVRSKQKATFQKECVKQKDIEKVRSIIEPGETPVVTSLSK